MQTEEPLGEESSELSCVNSNNDQVNDEEDETRHSNGNDNTTWREKGSEFVTATVGLALNYWNNYTFK